jgi:hypothetical protein
MYRIYRAAARQRVYQIHHTSLLVRVPLVHVFIYICDTYSVLHKLLHCVQYFMACKTCKSKSLDCYIHGLLQKSWEHNFSEISKAPTGISKFAAERQQRLMSNDAAI